MKKILSIIVSGILLISCTPGKDASYKFKVEERILFTEIPYPDILGTTIQLVKWDSLLFVNDYFGDSLIHVFNLSNGRIEKKLVSKGEGPNEAISPLDIQLSDNRLYALSRPLYSLRHIDLASINNDSIVLHKDMQLPPLSDCFVALGNARFVFSGLWEKRYAYLDLGKSDELKEFGEYPDFWSDEKHFPTDVKAFFHQCMFAKHPTKDYFVSCSGYVLEIYAFDPTGRALPRLHYRKLLGKYRYDFVKGDLVTAQVKEGSDPSAKEVTCTEDHIYIVMRSAADKAKRDIMVLDWDGQPVKLLKSDKKITCLSVDEKSKKGYCIIEDPEDTLVSFDL